MTRSGTAAKRVFDLMVGTLLFLGVLPFAVAIAVLIRLDSSGPVFYTEQRLGLKAEPFKVYKFRTMIVDAPEIRGADGSWENPKDDPRVTRVGRFLRASSLDELPQIINVLRGEMSLVGPRPDPIAALDLYEPRDHLRLSVLPGMTGWAAIQGRKSIPLRRRRELDLEYVENRSFLMDLKILAMTIPAVLRSAGVHSSEDGGPT